MAERLQPYLPNLAPGESDPLKTGEHYRGDDFSVEERHGDYHITITQEGFRKLSKHSRYSFDYQPVSAFSTDGKGHIRRFQMILTRDASLLINNPECHDGMIFYRSKLGLALIVKASLIGQLAAGERDFVMTRYDGHSDKIWIRMADGEQLQSAA